MANSIKFMNEGFEAKYGNIKPDLCEQIYTVLKRLTEANMSPEDEADTKLLYSIYKKKMKRSNAALTPEEKSVLKKYNLEDPQVSTDYYGIKRVHSKSGDSDVFEPVKKQGYRNNNVNLADRARKMKGRYDSKTGVGKYDNDYRQSYIDMKHEVDRKNNFQGNLNGIDNYYKDEEEKLLKQLDTLRKDHESSREISQRGLDASNSRINKMLKRESLLKESDYSDSFGGNRDDFLLDLSDILKALRGIDNISTHKAESVIDELIEIIKKYKYEALMGEGINKKKNK